MPSAFEVHKQGLAQLLRRRGSSGIVHAIQELISNAQDEDNVTRIDVRFEHIKGRAPTASRWRTMRPRASTT